MGVLASHFFGANMRFPVVGIVLESTGPMSLGKTVKIPDDIPRGFGVKMV
jgi:hypothetical protein